MIDRLRQALADRYTVERELGAGGMATVYLAHDIKHDRKVAIKVLRPELAAVIGAQRFLSEIKTTANLQHPHILPLHDSGEVDGTVFYVMPFVEGESLRDRLAREKQLPVADAVRIAGEVAGALDYAHRRGVIHRDIKPENILMHDGRALIADFGIALAASKTDGSSRMTETGMSLGTPHYMSPEQALGERNLDARTDVYALGCVLYEMLAGEPPFTGPSAQAIIARVMNEEPRSLTTQRRSVPQQLDDVVQVALAKLPADRFGSAAEFAAALTGGAGSAALPSRLARNAPPRRGMFARIAPWVIAAAGTGAAVVFARRDATTLGVAPMRFTVNPAGQDPGSQGGVSISPDGRVVVYGASADGVTRLYKRTLDDPVPQVIAGTDGVKESAFSLDGRWIVFAASDGHVKKVPVDGGTVLPLLTIGTPIGLTWASVGPVLGMPEFSGTYRTLTFIPERGDSVPHLLTAPAASPTPPPAASPSAGDTALPPGRRRAAGFYMEHGPVAIENGAKLLYEHHSAGGTRLGVATVATGKTQVTDFEIGEVVGAADGVLLYTDRGSSFMAVRFDAAGARVIGEPTRVLGVQGDFRGAALSANGTLAMRVQSTQYQAVLVDERGEGTPLLPDTANFLAARYSPDGRRVALSGDIRRTPTTWLLETATGSLTKLPPSDRSTVTTLASWMQWSPDGQRLATGTVSRNALYWRSADERGTRSPLLNTGSQMVVSASLSSDGTVAALGTAFGPTGFDIMVQRLGDSTMTPFVASAANEMAPRFSPDGRWIAYASDESGRLEVYARPYPGPGNRVQFSQGGGEQPVWSRDGKRLFYLSGRTMMAAELSGSAELTVVKRTPLFSGDFYSVGDLGGRTATYDVAPDGKHFVVPRAVGRAGSEIVVWTNWLPELKKRLEAGK